MNEAQGKVVDVVHDADGPRLIVDVEATLACPRCAAGRGCGAGLLDGRPGTRRIAARIAAGPEPAPGDTVCLRLDAHGLLQAALIVYGLPLAGAALAAAGAYLLGFGDAGAALLAIGGLACGLALGRRHLRRAGCIVRFTPVAEPVSMTARSCE